MHSSTNPTELFPQVIRQAAIDAAWDRAIRVIPQLTLLGETGGSLKVAMGRAVDAAMGDGVLDLEILIETALERVPKLRAPNGHKSHPV